MNANTLKKIKRQISELEGSLRDLPDTLQDAISQNEDIDCLVMADDLFRLGSIMEYLLNDDNYYASSIMANEDFPGKAIWTDRWNRKWIPQVLDKAGTR